MHICFISHEYLLWGGGGVGSFIQTLGRQLIGRGHQVSVVGVVDITSMNTIKNGEDLLGDDILAFPVESPLLLNIDTLADWDAANAFCQSQEETS